jgi:hypothetical protein
MWWLLAFLYLSGAVCFALMLVDDDGRFPNRFGRLMLAMAFWPVAVWLAVMLAANEVISDKK